MVLKEILFLVDFIIDLFFAFLEKEAVWLAKNTPKKLTISFNLSLPILFFLKP